jgi:hypothetical protein
LGVVEPIDPSELLAVLDRGDPVQAACAEAVEQGASVFRSPDDLTVAAAHLVSIYRRRLDHLRAKGAKTIGSYQFLAQLGHAPPQTALSVIAVRGKELNFSVFIDASRQAVATLGVDRSLENPSFEWDALEG